MQTEDLAVWQMAALAVAVVEHPSQIWICPLMAFSLHMRG